MRFKCDDDMQFLRIFSFIMTSTRQNETYMKFDCLSVFPQPIKFHVTSGIRVWRHYKKGLLTLVNLTLDFLVLDVNYTSSRKLTKKVSIRAYILPAPVYNIRNLHKNKTKRAALPNGVHCTTITFKSVGTHQDFH